MHAIKTVGIVSKPNVQQAHDVVPSLLAWLRHHGIQARCDNETAYYGGCEGDAPASRCPRARNW